MYQGNNGGTAQEAGKASGDKTLSNINSLNHLQCEEIANKMPLLLLLISGFPYTKIVPLMSL